MYKYIVLPILLLLVMAMLYNGIGLLASCIPTVQAARTTPVTFINENPGKTTLGLAKFIMKDGKAIDYKLMNMRWDYKLYVIDLEPGVYGVTQYASEINAIVSFQIITVGNDTMFVKFRRL